MEDLKEIFAQKGFSLCFSSVSVALYHALQCRRWKTGALLVTSRWESWLEKSRRCLASLPLQNLGLSLMALLVYSAQQLQPPPHQPTKRNLVFSKPCSPCSSLLPPQPPPQHLPPPNVAAFWEVGSLVVPAMTRPPPPQLLQPPPPQSVEAFLEEAFSAAQAMTRRQPPPPQPRQPQPQPPPNVEVLLEGDFFANKLASLEATLVRNSAHLLTDGGEV